MSITRRYEVEDDEEAYDADGILKDGQVARIRMIMRDGATVSEGIARDLDEYDKRARGRMLVDAMGEPISGPNRRPGFVYATDADSGARRALDRDYAKAELSSRWKGGLSDGDQFTLGTRGMEVTGRNPETGKVVLSDASQVDADDAKREAYNDGVAAMTEAWKTRPVADTEPGDACTTSNGSAGKWRRGPNGLVCRPDNEREPSDNGFAMAGPLSDSDARAVKDAAYAESVEALQNAWRR